MTKTQIAITGALSYTGRYITKLLIERFGARDLRIININNRKLPNPFAESGLELITHPYDFTNSSATARALEGSHLFVSTYWMRFDNFKISRDQVVTNAKMLVDCAKQAGVKRYVYVSHTQAKTNSSIPYIAGKAQVEAYVKDKFRDSYGIIKPCAIFGDTPDESILVNNLAYLLRTFPVMAIVGDGKYPLHPVHVRDLARLCIEAGLDEHQQGVYEWDAVNPEKMSFIELLTTIRDIIGTSCWLQTHVPLELAYLCTRPLNWYHRDILIDKTDISVMMLQVSGSREEPRGRIKFSDWIRENQHELGRKYISSLERYYN